MKTMRALGVLAVGLYGAGFAAAGCFDLGSDCTYLLLCPSGEVCYVEERSLREYVAAMGISDATAGRYHKELKERLRAVLLAEEITSPPEVE